MSYSHFREAGENCLYQVFNTTSSCAASNEKGQNEDISVSLITDPFAMKVLGGFATVRETIAEEHQQWIPSP